MILQWLTCFGQLCIPYIEWSMYWMESSVTLVSIFSCLSPKSHVHGRKVQRRYGSTWWTAIFKGEFFSLSMLKNSSPKCVAEITVQTHSSIIMTRRGPAKPHRTPRFRNGGTFVFGLSITSLLVGCKCLAVEVFCMSLTHNRLCGGKLMRHQA